MKQMTASVLKAVFMFGIFIFLFSSCDKSSDPDSDTYVNDWILKQMDIYYLWNNDIPDKPNKSVLPDVFFKSLLSDQDRFSWIQENYIELLNSLQGVNKEAGYEFILYRESSFNENVIAQIVYVKPNSPATTNGLQRGDVITKINGTQMTLSNYKDLLGQISLDHSIQYKRYNSETTVFEDKGTVSLNAIEYAENPNFMHTVLTVGDKKIGYYVYNFFANGPTQSSSQYNTEMDEIFADFKAQSITHLILDLRYNSGGSETAAINLASLIGTGVNSMKQFASKQYNDFLTNEILTDPDLGERYLKSNFLTKTQNIGDQISGKVYVLTRDRTASASELVINGLKPYMGVFIIGDTTVGKNVGSFSLYEKNNSKNTWGMQPIVVKIFNKDGDSDYGDGFIPNIANNDNNLVLLPLGDQTENLLSLALAEINGSGGRQTSIHHKSWGRMLGSSLDRKRRALDIVMDDVQLENALRSVRFSN